MRARSVLLIILLVLLLAAAVQSQSSDDYILMTSVLDESGGSPESSNNKMVASSAGQPTPIGVSQSANYKAYAGYIYTLEVTCVDPPEIVHRALSNGTQGCAYSECFELQPGTGTRALHWTISAGSLPPGLLLDRTSGCVSGMPAETGAFNFTIQVMDLCGETDTEAFSITIDPYEDVPGDVNADCAVNVIDVVLLTNCCILEMCLCSEDMRRRGDINGPPGNCDGDGRMNVLDSMKIVRIILELDECP